MCLGSARAVILHNVDRDTTADRTVWTGAQRSSRKHARAPCREESSCHRELHRSHFESIRSGNDSLPQTAHDLNAHLFPVDGSRQLEGPVPGVRTNLATPAYKVS